MGLPVDTAGRLFITVKDNLHLIISTGLYYQKFLVFDGDTYANINMLQHNGRGKVRFPPVLQYITLMFF